MSYRYGRPVPELQEIIDARHFNELQAYDRIRPPDHIRWEFYFAQLACIIANANRSKETPAFKMTEFVFDKPKPKQWTDDMMFDYFVGLCVAMGGKPPDGYHSKTQHDANG